ncbi:hypothetical protein B0H67DRAFT_146433 [Lasiosphaeris hirsuta]|uniref:Uncharacterized protein n=1 Tax=Lasiosphaeris hirsuta TaxID=260670 RepID=A0AA40B1P4_9PEZI|nr:hypothetical protein B0H67DRAFT_146433 [Lasiosphaeris hirsuta]
MSPLHSSPTSPGTLTHTVNLTRLPPANPSHLSHCHGMQQPSARPSQIRLLPSSRHLISYHRASHHRASHHRCLSPTHPLPSGQQSTPSHPADAASPCFNPLLHPFPQAPRATTSRLRACQPSRWPATSQAPSPHLPISLASPPPPAIPRPTRTSVVIRLPLPSPPPSLQPSRPGAGTRARGGYYARRAPAAAAFPAGPCVSPGGRAVSVGGCSTEWMSATAR